MSTSMYSISLSGSKKGAKIVGIGYIEPILGYFRETGKGLFYPYLTPFIGPKVQKPLF